MPESPTSLATYLSQRKTEILDKLRAIAPDLTRELIGVQNGLDALATGIPTMVRGEYEQYRMATDAIVACLKTAGKPMEEHALCTAVLEGGWGLHQKRRAVSVIDAIRKGVNGPGLRSLTKMDGKIGLAEWEQKERL